VIGVSPLQLSGILVTHEHSDHVQGVPMLMKHYAVPVISDPRTLEAIEEGIITKVWRTDTGKVVVSNDSLIVGEVAEFSTKSLFVPFPVGSQRLFGDIEVTSFSTSHDAVASCGYLLHAGGCRVCFATDTGRVTPETHKAIRHADLLILEANYNREHLLHGPYPLSVKRRIMSSNGHLSNAQAARAVLKSWSLKGARWLWLAHLSRTNNTPSLAIDHMRAHLQKAGVNLSQITITALPPGMGEVWDSTGLWY
jgi:phosphoribosyl 1,2-cyclic phosphodiesterase